MSRCQHSSTSVQGQQIDCIAEIHVEDSHSENDRLLVQLSYTGIGHYGAQVKTFKHDLLQRFHDLVVENAQIQSRRILYCSAG